MPIDTTPPAGSSFGKTPPSDTDWEKRHSKINEYESSDESLQENQTYQGKGISPDIIRENPNVLDGRRTREPMAWRVPGMGFVEMYINPQQMNIQEQKVIKPQRTKGGYIIQYWGEELVTIKLNGTTGSSGIEGINILRDIYRAEQNSFQQIEQIMVDRFKEYTVGSSISGIVGRVANDGISGAGKGILGSVLGGSSNPPLLPTLGSLAVAVELYYQGWVFKGYFTSFNVTEAVTEGVGVFKYDLNFTVLDRRGIRRNNMPWHRTPATLDPYGNPKGYNIADSNSVPLSFRGEK